MQKLVEFRVGCRSEDERRVNVAKRRHEYPQTSAGNAYLALHEDEMRHCNLILSTPQVKGS